MDDIKTTRDSTGRIGAAGETAPIPSQSYRDAMSHFAGAVHVVTTEGPAGRRGVTVSAAASVSDDPPTVLVCLNRNRAENTMFADNGCFAVNVLTGEHLELARAFAGEGHLEMAQRFAFGKWGELATGAPHRRLTPLRLCAGETPLFTLPPGDGAIPSQVLVRVPATALDGQGDLALTLHAPAFGGPEGEGYVALVAVTLLDPHWANPLAYLHNSVAWSDGKGRLHIDLSRDRHRALVAPGLSFSPAWGAGSAGGAVQLALPLLPGAGPLRLTVLARPVADADTPVTLTAALNGTVLATQTCTTDMPLRLRLAVPAALLADTAPAVLSVVADSVATPADLALGATREIAGFGLTDLFVTPEED